MQLQQYNNDKNISQYDHAATNIGLPQYTIIM